MINGIEFHPNCDFSKRVSSDKDVQSQIMKSWNPNSGKFNADKIPLEPSSSKNLKLSIGHATILNPHVTSDGYFEGTLYDKYDYTRQNFLKIVKNDILQKHLGSPKNHTNEKLPEKIIKDFGISFVNNRAVGLHEKGKLEYYYYFVPVKFKVSTK